MKIRQYTVMFELEVPEGTDDAPITFETAMRMAIRHRDLTSVEWLNDRIRKMHLTDTKTIEG